MLELQQESISHFTVGNYFTKLCYWQMLGMNRSHTRWTVSLQNKARFFYPISRGKSKLTFLLPYVTQLTRNFVKRCCLPTVRVTWGLHTESSAQENIDSSLHENDRIGKINSSSEIKVIFFLSNSNKCQCNFQSLAVILHPQRLLHVCLKSVHTPLLPGSSGEYTAAKPDQINTMGDVPKKIKPLYPVESMQTLKSTSILLAGNLLEALWFGVRFIFYEVLFEKVTKTPPPLPKDPLLCFKNDLWYCSLYIHLLLYANQVRYSATVESSAISFLEEAPHLP